MPVKPSNVWSNNDGTVDKVYPKSILFKLLHPVKTFCPNAVTFDAFSATRLSHPDNALAHNISADNNVSVFSLPHPANTLSSARHMPETPSIDVRFPHP
jgi:hypothetical protein